MIRLVLLVGRFVTRMFGRISRLELMEMRSNNSTNDEMATLKKELQAARVSQAELTYEATLMRDELASLRRAETSPESDPNR